MTISYTQALIFVFGGLLAISIVLVLGLILLWLSLRAHEKLLLTEVRASHQRTTETLASIQRAQVQTEQHHLAMLNAAYAFQETTSVMKDIVDTQQRHAHGIKKQ